VFNKKLLSVIAKSLGVITIICSVIVVIAGFFSAGTDGGTDAFEQAGYFIGFVGAGLALCAFLYLVVGAFHHVIQRNSSIPASQNDAPPRIEPR
jgi:hypothetical protein